MGVFGGQVALVTSGGNGIGLASARRLAGRRGRPLATLAPTLKS